MSLNHSFSVEHAQIYGMECAIIIHHFQFWIEHNRSLGRNLHDGKTWTYQTNKEIAAYYPYMSEDTVFRIIKKLIDRGVLIKGNFNKSRFDRTVWYAFVNEEKFTIPRNRGMDRAEDKSPFRDFAEPIPDTIPYSKTKDIIDLGPKTLPCKKNKEKTLEISKRWNLSEEQSEIFEWLKSKGIDAEDKKLAFWAKKHRLQRLIDVYNESIHNKASSLRAYMGYLLDNNKTVHNASIQANADFVKDFARENKWNSIKIFKKYVKFNMGNTWQELPLDMDSIQFIGILMQKFENSEER